MSEGDRVIKIETFVGDSYQLEIWAEESIENPYTLNLKELIRFASTQAFLRENLRGDFFEVDAYWINNHYWLLNFNIPIDSRVLVISETVAEFTIQLTLDQVVASRLLVSSIRQKWEQLVAPPNRQYWEARVNQLIVCQDIRQIALSVDSITICHPFNERVGFVEINVTTERSRVRQFEDMIQIDRAIALQAQVIKTHYCNEFCRITIIPEIEHCETVVLNRADETVLRFWTKPRVAQPMRSQLPSIAPDVFPSVPIETEGASEMLQRVTRLQGNAWVRRFRLEESPPPSRGEIPGCIGDTTCRYNARKPSIRCAVNPCGPCEGCSDYQEINLQE